LFDNNSKFSKGTERTGERESWNDVTMDRYVADRKKTPKKVLLLQLQLFSFPKLRKTYLLTLIMREIKFFWPTFYIRVLTQQISV
jgi:hypothetical protein